jgi:hypothetical protein
MRTVTTILLTALIVLGASAPAAAGRDFAGYEGPDAIKKGEGGTKITKNGIDYWTTGTPPRRYQVLGIMTDKRYEDWGVTVIGSPSVAKLTLKIGGNAVILLDQKDKTVGTAGFGSGSVAGNSVFGSMFGINSDRTTSRLVVIKYLD